MHHCLRNSTLHWRTALDVMNHCSFRGLQALRTALSPAPPRAVVPCHDAPRTCSKWSCNAELSANHRPTPASSGSPSSSTTREPLITAAERAAVLDKRRAAAERRRQQLGQHAAASDGLVPASAAKVVAREPQPGHAAQPSKSQGTAAARQAGAKHMHAQGPESAAQHGGFAAALQGSALAAALPHKRQRTAHPAGKLHGTSLPAGKFPKQSKRGATEPYRPEQLAYEAASQQNTSQTAPAAVPGESKQCRRCSEVHQLGRFFVDKRTEDGFMHYCAHCAHKKGLSGRPPTAAELAAARAHAAKLAAREKQAANPSRAGQAATSPHKAALAERAAHVQGSPRRQVQRQAFYQQRSRAEAAHSPGQHAHGSVAPAVAAVRAGVPAKRKQEAQRDLEDDYDADFIDDGDDDEDWRQELASVRTS